MNYDVTKTKDGRKVILAEGRCEEIRESLGSVPGLDEAPAERPVLLLITANDASFYWSEVPGRKTVPGEVDYGSPFHVQKGESREILQRLRIDESL